MKTRIGIVLAFVLVSVSCAEHACPTYGSHYIYSPPKKKLFKSWGSSSKKPAKKAEQ